MKLNIDIEAQISRISPLTKKGVFGVLVGEYKSAFRGRGLEFTTFRNYDESDDAIRIDWKASLKSQDTLVRVFEEERDLKVYFLFDTSNSMLYSSHAKLKAEYAAELVAALSYGILKAEDSVGLIMFSDEIKTFIRAQIGDAQFFKMADALTSTKNYAGVTDYQKLISFCMSSLPRTSILFLVTDYIGLPEHYEHFLEPYNEKFESIGFMIRDPVDDELPTEGTTHLLDPFSNDELEVNSAVMRRRYHDYVVSFKKELAETYRKSNDDIVEFRTDDDYLHTLLEYFALRKSRTLRRGH